TVVEGDTLIQIAMDHGLDDNGYLLIHLLNPQINPNTQIIFVGQTILLPPPGMQLPTATPLPSNAPPGYKSIYFVLPGDSLGSIANKLNSTVDAIVKANKDLLKDGDQTIIYPGWTLVVPINLITPQPTSTPAVTVTDTPTATKTP
ncbi:MAG: LysM peptidoglycan-binding domain-containing protein, partial [Anaerolineales bacterium]|nr:LysM peptidoglycan-binding domain-containing protein [Anaerolineales bacterium]